MAGAGVRQRVGSVGEWIPKGGHVFRMRWVCALSGALVLLGAGVAQAAPRWGRYHRSVCAAVAGEMHCLAQEAMTSAGGSPLASSTPPAGSYRSGSAAGRL